MTNEQINEAIYEWELSHAHSGDDVRPAIYDPPDYFTDESDNARLLEAMPNPHLSRAVRNLWSCFPDLNTMMDSIKEVREGVQGEYEHPDRKTAIVLAFLKFSGIEAKHE